MSGAAKFAPIGVFLVSAGAAAAFLLLRKSEPVTSPAAAVPTASAVVEPADYLVWAGQAGDDPHEQPLDTVRTFWLRTDATGTRIEGEIQGVVSLHDGQAWRWTPSEKDIPPCVCSGTPVAGAGKSLGARVQKLGSEETKVVVEPPEYCNSDAPAPSVTLLGSVGPYLFVRTDHTEYGCGAHGIAVPQFFVWSLASGEPVDLFKDAEATNARNRAWQMLAPADAGIEAPRESDLELVQLQPAFDDHGVLAIEGGFKSFACHACTGATSFVWGQYSRGVLVPIDRLPSSLAAYGKTPAAVVAFVAGHRDRVVGGWSTPGAGQSLSDVIRAEFEKATP